jgi:plasmid maintenance system antidote protein VapI
MNKRLSPMHPGEVLREEFSGAAQAVGWRAVSEDGRAAHAH